MIQAAFTIFTVAYIIHFSRFGYTKDSGVFLGNGIGLLFLIVVERLSEDKIVVPTVSNVIKNLLFAAIVVLSVGFSIKADFIKRGRSRYERLTGEEAPAKREEIPVVIPE